MLVTVVCFESLDLSSRRGTRVSCLCCACRFRNPALYAEHIGHENDMQGKTASGVARLRTRCVGGVLGVS